MNKKMIRSVVLVCSLIMLAVSSVNATLGYIHTKTDSLKNTFTPSVTPPDPDEALVSIAVTKNVNNTGTGEMGPEGFEFVLHKANSSDKQLVETDQDGKATFNLSFAPTDIGRTFEYTLYETNEGLTDVEYDNTVYDVRIDITLGDDNKAKATVYIDGDAMDEPAVEFTNVYNGEEDTPTGRDNNYVIWIVLAAVSAAAAVAVVILGRKKK